MKRLIVANWKMNPTTYRQSSRLAAASAAASRRLRNVDVVICPSFVWLERLVRTYGRRLAFGAQDAFWEDRGPYTGEVSPAMLKSIGIRWVILGHSERRRHLGETDEMINRKVRSALAAGLAVILCVGETLEEWRRGHTAAVLRWQLEKDLTGVSKSEMQKSKLVIAYEPVWAIGTGLPETPQNANRAAAFIRRRVGKEIRVLYGGSVNAKNIGGYLAMPEISGALVGGASLRAVEFIKMLAIANSV
jgi:triosephosphate isomerase